MNNDCAVIEVHGWLKILVSPLIFALDLMVPTQRAFFRGRDSLLFVLTLMHSRAPTFTQTHVQSQSLQQALRHLNFPSTQEHDIDMPD